MKAAAARRRHRSDSNLCGTFNASHAEFDDLHPPLLVEIETANTFPYAPRYDGTQAGMCRMLVHSDGMGHQQIYHARNAMWPAEHEKSQGPSYIARGLMMTEGFSLHRL